jgi:flavodoxin-like protein
MKALVVYESMYGNTRHVAQAIAEGLRVSVDAHVVPIGDAAASFDVEDPQLLIVGAPTHAWGLSRRRTRESAANEIARRSDRRVSTLTVATGVREWLRAAKGHGCRSAAFDTRLDRPRLFTGSAVSAIQRGLLVAGFTLFSEPRSFRVKGTIGPLAIGELDRARAWGEEMGRNLVEYGAMASQGKAASR